MSEKKDARPAEVGESVRFRRGCLLYEGVVVRRWVIGEHDGNAIPGIDVNLEDGKVVSAADAQVEEVWS